MPGQWFLSALSVVPFASFGLGVATETPLRTIGRSRTPGVSTGFPQFNGLIRSAFGSLVCVACGLSACAAPQAGSATRAPIGSAPSPTNTQNVVVSRTIVTPTDAATVEEIFARARVDLAEKRFTDAAR